MFHDPRARRLLLPAKSRTGTFLSTTYHSFDMASHEKLRLKTERNSPCFYASQLFRLATVFCFRLCFSFDLVLNEQATSARDRHVVEQAARDELTRRQFGYRSSRSSSSSSSSLSKRSDSSFSSRRRASASSSSALTWNRTFAKCKFLKKPL